jgi:hypothetical protein
MYNRIPQCFLVELESRSKPAELEFMHWNSQCVKWSFPYGELLFIV